MDCLPFSSSTQPTNRKSEPKNSDWRVGVDFDVVFFGGGVSKWWEPFIGSVSHADLVALTDSLFLVSCRCFDLIAGLSE